MMNQVELSSSHKDKKLKTKIESSQSIHQDTRHYKESGQHG